MPLPYFTPQFDFAQQAPGYPSGDPGVTGMPGNAQTPEQQGILQRILESLGGGVPAGGLLDPAAAKGIKNQYLLNLGAGLLAGSGSGQRFGPILGQALQGAQAQKGQAINEQIQQMLLAAQVKKAQKEDKGDLVSIIGEDGKPQYIRASDAIGKTPYANQGNQAAPPASLAEYDRYVEQEKAAGRVPEDLIPFTQRLAKARVGAQYAQTVQMVGGVPTLVQGDRTGQTSPTQTPLSTAEAEAEAKRRQAAAEAGGKATGDAQAAAQIDLPGAKAKADLAIKNIDDLIASPGLSYITDKASIFPIVPGTAQANADALAKNLQGKTFLEAVQALKGSGQITEIEGTKAEAAIGRLQRAQSTGAYKAALRELRTTIEEGVKRKVAAAGGGSTAPQGGGAVRVRVDASGNVVQ